MGNLFTRGGLEQETGLLSERWQQEGSELVTITGVNNADATLYTVTTNKTLYIKSIIMSESSASSGVTIFKDGSAGATKFTYAESNSQQTNTIIFDVPLAFENEVYIDINSGVSFVTMVGWEE